MQDLRVIGVENGALLVVSDDGDRYRIPIDEVLQSKLRQSTPDPGVGRKLSPKEIQAHIRSGMSAQDVSSVTGVPLEYIQKFEGPVLAEREFVIETALGVAVHASMDTGDIMHGATFGTAIRTRLQALGAINERWASWKDPGAGWVVKLSFTADQIDHDARWSFDPRKLSLSPLNGEATTLSQQGEAPTGLVPRLRAVSTTKQPDSTRFDSGAFDLGDPGPSLPTESASTTSRFAPEATNDHNQTADLLDALRRRRGEREAASFGDDDDVMAAHPSTGGIRLVDVPMPAFEVDDAPTPSPAPSSAESISAESPSATKPQPSVSKPRKGRTAMPSWDDIVFGARPDDDLA